MMRLRKMNAGGSWSVYAAIEEDESCALLDALRDLAADPKTESTAAGFFALWDRIPPEGPHTFGDHIYECLNANNHIYEFRRRGHRVVCFQAQGRVIVCSHIFAKQSQRTPKKQINRAKRMRDEFLAEVALDAISYE